MNKIKLLALIIIGGGLLSACNTKKEEAVSLPQPTPTVKEVKEPLSPTESFLIKLTKETDLAFSSPIKADMIWTEGETLEARKTFFGDSFLIEHQDPKADEEKTLEKYFLDKGFSYMKFNESRGEDSHRVGYRKNELVCKYDWSKYPDEPKAHLNVYCTDATKGTERK